MLTTLQKRSNTHRFARVYYRREWFSIPLCGPVHRNCECDHGHEGKGISKAPLIRFKEFQENPPSLEQIDEWWERWPKANIGILVRPSGLFVIDVDGPDAWAEVKKLGIGNGPRFKTGNGRQLLYSAPDGVAGRRIKCGVSRSIDILAEGYIVAPPSRHRNGRSYEWEVRLEEEGLQDPPEWAVSMLSACSTVSPTRSVELPDDLPIVEVEELRVLDRIKRLIREGEDSSRYPSRSEPVFAVVQALIDAEYRDEVIAAVLQNPDNAISSKPLEKGKHWVAQEIARARDKNNHARIKTSQGTEVLQVQPSFPVEVLPQPVRNFVTQGSASLPCPADFLAVTSLVLIGGAIGSTRVVEIKPGWQETPRLWWSFVAPPGDLKSPAFKLAKRWINRRQAGLFAQWKAKKEKDKSYREPCKRLFTTDATIEALGNLLRDNSRGLILLADELSGWYQGIGQYKDRRGSDRKHYLSLWSGETLTVDRVGRAPVMVPEPFLSIVGGIQPDALRDLDPEAGARDGFLHRILLVEPRPVKIRYTKKIVSKSTLKEIGQLYNSLYSLRPREIDTHTRAYEPKVLKFHEQAKKDFVEWYDEHGAEMDRADFPAHLSGPWSKLRGYCPSLALILALAKNPNAEIVGEDATLGAISLIEDYLKPHLRRLYPRMLAHKAKPSEHDQCRAKVMRYLGVSPLTHRELRQKIGGRSDGPLVDEVLRDLYESGQVGKRSEKRQKNTVDVYYIQRKAA